MAHRFHEKDALWVRFFHPVLELRVHTLIFDSVIHLADLHLS